MSSGEPRFGTFGGVFTPCTLTILGVIMFLRFGQVVGNAGLWQALAIVAIAKSITTFTGFSLSAIATNTRVQGGGAYYLISRSLGVEFGGAIGIVFFLAQAISVAMYVVGFTEALVDVVPALGESSRWVSTVVNVGVFACVYVGAGWTIKVQYLILGVLAASLVSFLAGAIPQIDPALLEANLGSDYASGEGFFTMFALFFPAVTGIMAGANMSGDLRNPARSIPAGTLSAIAVTGAVYVLIAVLLACTRSSETLIADNLVMKQISLSPTLITAGIFAATLSSALGSMMGSPRILQAFARDRVFSWLNFFAVGSGRTREPRRATVLTFLIAQACILLGDLDLIAPVITMAFMITYGTLNLATFYESVTKNPSYRPRFRFSHWSTAFLGFIGCLVVMFLISPLWAAVSIAAMAAIHWLIGLREIESRWGSVKSGVLFERARTNLLRLEEELYHPKNWRPIILALSGAGWARPHLAVYGRWLEAGHGILSLGQVITGPTADRAKRRASQQQVLHNFIREQRLEAFPAVIVAPTLSEGIEGLVQTHGLGALRANTVLFGWPHDPARVVDFGTTLRFVSRLDRSLAILRLREEAADPWHVPPGTIDIWWRGMKNGALMVVLAHLLSKNDAWRTRQIRLMRVVPSAAGTGEVRRHLEELIDTARIRARAEVHVGADPAAIIQRESRGAALVFLGFEAPEEGDELQFWHGMERFAGDLERVLFVDSAGEVRLES